MNFPFYIARRYLFSKKSHNAINVISLISVCGVVIATIALVCALSVYNGFNDLVSSLFSHFDPELKITARYGKVFNPDNDTIRQIRNMPEVAIASEVLQDNALIKYKERQEVGVIKGVDNRFSQLVNIDSVLIDGEFKLSDEVANYAILGIGLASHLGINAGFISPLEIYVPKRDQKVNMANPAASFNHGYLYSPGSVFIVGQPQYDESFIITDLDFVRHLMGYTGEVSAIELRAAPGADIGLLKAKIRDIVGDRFAVLDIYEQQSDVFKVINIEKLISFIFLALIIIIAALNVIGSIAMLIIDKRDDLKTIRCLGAQRRDIVRIFLMDGWLISLLGAVSGIALGIVLCLVQQHFGIISFGDGGTFMAEAYPVRVSPGDVGIIFVTVIVAVMLTIWLPTRYLCRRLLD